jgi:hypothetical protein
MPKPKAPSPVTHEEELAKLELLPKRIGRKRTDDLLLTMLNSPPDPRILKPKPKRRTKK